MEVDPAAVVAALTAVVAPILTNIAKRYAWADDLATSVNAGLSLVIALGLWLLVTKGNTGELLAYLLAGGVGGHLGTVGYNVQRQVRKVRERSDRLTFSRRLK